MSSVLDDPAFADFFLRFRPNATQTGRCWGEEDPRQRGSPWDPIWPTPAVCEALLPTDVHVPLCDKAEPTKCNSVHYFDQNQVPQVPGVNWSNDTEDVYQGLVCRGATCDCGASPCGVRFDVNHTCAPYNHAPPQKNKPLTPTLAFTP